MKKLFDRRLIIQSALVALGYSILVTYIPNFSLLWRTLTGSHIIGYKITILIGLTGGLLTNNTPQSLAILLTTASFTGINMGLIFRRFALLRQQGPVRLTVGVSSLLGVLGHGCSACGLPILVLLGLGGSLSFLPFRGTELSYVSLLLVLMTFVLIIRGTDRGGKKLCPECTADLCQYPGRYHSHCLCGM